MQLEKILSPKEYALVLRQAGFSRYFYPTHMALLAWQLGLITLSDLAAIFETELALKPFVTAIPLGQPEGVVS